MSTFIGQLVGFAIIVWLIWRFVIPPMRKLMADQQQSVRSQLTESAAAAERLAEADQAHTEAVARAKVEAQRVTDEAHADAERIAQQLRAQADAEVERIKTQGTQQIALLRAQLVRQLRADLGSQSWRRAADLVRDHVDDPAQRSATVDRFLGELDAMAPSPAAVEAPVSATMRSTSRTSLTALVRRFDEVARGLDDQGLSALAGELVSIARLLGTEAVLTRYLTVPAEEPTAKIRLVQRLLAGKVGEPALDLLKTAVSLRWSAGSDLLDAVEHAARQALLLRAEHAGQIDEVEDELFRFSRILDAQPRLDRLLGDDSTPADGRVRLLRRVLDGASRPVNPTAVELLCQTVELLRGRSAQQAVVDLAEAAVARRGEIVAHVSAAAPLSDAQLTRLTQVLGRIYDHPVTVQLQADPAVLGGLAITVGDEVIDGTLSSRLAAAQAQLPD